jgi:hypothetical protein
MYNAIWEKYLSVIRILLKRAVNEDQSLKLNSSDFEKTGPQKKTGFNFTLRFSNGRVDNLASLSAVAKEMAAVLLAEPQIKELLQQGEYHLTMNTKFVLGIKVVSHAGRENELPQAQPTMEATA